MNRRQFFGVALAACIAALVLAFEPLLEWCRAWLGARNTALLVSDVANFELGMRIKLQGEYEWTVKYAYVAGIRPSAGEIVLAW